MGLGLPRALSRRARNRTGGRGEAGVFSGEGRGYGGSLSTEFGAQKTGRRAATVGLIVESWAVLRRWTIFTYEWVGGFQYRL